MSNRRVTGKAWTYDEHLLAMNLYCKLPFGRLHKAAPEIIDLAKMLNRTPSSVSMKLCNFASLDPHLSNRGIKGLAGVSNAARTVWEEFHRDWERLADQSEQLRESLVMQASAPVEKESNKGPLPNSPSAPTEREQMVYVRRTQRFFRATVLASYDFKCSITGIQLSDFLIASHIMRWADYPEHRTNPRNGICLSRIYDAAFENGLVSFDDDFRLLLSREIKEHFTCEAIRAHFTSYEGKIIQLPDKFIPDPAFISHHREHRFRHN